MNDIVKKTIIDTINANNINLKRTPGTDEYTVINKTGQPVLNVVNGWDYGIYSVNVGGIVVSYIECNPDAPNKTPEQIVRSACSGVLFAPLTMEIYESTANGTGNYFHQEWERAKRGESDKEPLFVPWFDIEMYELPLADSYRFAQELYENRNNRANYGAYDWWLWERGATLEAINWYQHNRKRFDDHADMAAEYPSDDIEAFKHSGKKVFDQYKVEAFGIVLPQEKVYLHMDNTCYFIGDTIWYKGYVTRSDRRTLTDLSQILYAELLTPDGFLVERQQLKMKEGTAHGMFVLQDSLYAGYYELRGSMNIRESTKSMISTTTSWQKISSATMRKFTPASFPSTTDPRKKVSSPRA